MADSLWAQLANKNGSQIDQSGALPEGTEPLEATMARLKALSALKTSTPEEEDAKAKVSDALQRQIEAHPDSGGQAPVYQYNQPEPLQIDVRNPQPSGQSPMFNSPGPNKSMMDAPPLSHFQDEKYWPPPGRPMRFPGPQASAVPAPAPQATGSPTPPIIPVEAPAPFPVPAQQPGQMAPAPQQPGQVASPPPGAVPASEVTTAQQNRSKLMEQLQAELGKMNPGQSGLEGQQAAVNDYQAALKAYLGNRPEDGINTLNLKPLGALADSWSGPNSHLAASYTPPQTGAQFDEKALAAREKMAAIQGSLATSQNAITKEKLATMLGMYKANMGSPSASAYGSRTNDLIHARVVSAIQQDKQLKDLAQSQYNLTSGATNYDSAKIKGTQQLHELQNTVRSNLGIKGTTTGPERDKMMMDSFGNQWRNAKQWLYGTPVDGSVEMKEMADHLMNLVQLQQESNMARAHARLNTLTTGREEFYSRPENADKQAGLDRLKEVYRQQFNPYRRKGDNPSMGAPTGPEAPGAHPVDTMPAAEVDRQLREMGLL